MAKKDLTKSKEKPKGNRQRKDLHPELRKVFGAALKSKRIEKNLSLMDVSLMSDMSKTAVWNTEIGKTKGIDHYFEYAIVVGLELTILPSTEIVYQPRYDLPAKNKERIFLTQKIRELITEEGLFEIEITVSEIIDLLETKKGVFRNKELSTRVSGILRNWVEEDGILTKRKEGRINYYRKR